MGYNADLYDNYTSASWHPNGLVGLSVLVQIGQMSNIELRKITDAAASVPYRGKHIGSFNVTQGHRGKFEPGKAQYSTPNLFKGCFL